MRINKYIASGGLCSRRKAEKLILSNKVTINKKIAKITDQVQTDDIVLVNKKLIKPEKNIYILLNKPVGYTCTIKKIKGEKNILELIKIKEKIFPVGRLDKNSKGLLLLTNDGDFAQKIIHPHSGHQKIYEVILNNNITNEQIKKILNGVKIKIDDKNYLSKPRGVKKITPKKIKIILNEGKNRQIRKTIKAIGLKILELKRTNLAGLTIKNLPEKKWRYLTKEELTKLNNL